MDPMPQWVALGVGRNGRQRSLRHSPQRTVCRWGSTITWGTKRGRGSFIATRKMTPVPFDSREGVVVAFSSPAVIGQFGCSDSDNAV